MEYARKILIITVLLLAFLVFAPNQVFASCEGIEPRLLLAAWYNPVDDILIERVGDQPDREVGQTYILKKRTAEEEIFSISGIGKTDTELPISTEAMSLDDSYPGAPKDPTLTSFAQTLRGQLQFLVGGKEYASYAEWQSAVEDLIAKIDAIIAQDKTYIALKPQPQCPYFIEKDGVVTRFTAFVKATRSPDGKTLRKIYETSKDGTVKSIGRLTDDAPHGEETETTVDQKPICWGHDGKTEVLAFHWVYECQGEGDLTQVLSDLGH